MESSFLPWVPDPTPFRGVEGPATGNCQEEREPKAARALAIGARHMPRTTSKDMPRTTNKDSVPRTATRSRRRRTSLRSEEQEPVAAEGVSSEAPVAADAASSESVARPIDDETSEARIMRLRKHISEQHVLLVEQQQALRKERHAHASTAIGAENLCREVAALEALIEATNAERSLQQQHMLALEQALHGATSSTVTRTQLPTACEPPLNTPAPHGPLQQDQEPSIEPSTAPAPAAAPDWDQLVAEYDRPCW